MIVAYFLYKHRAEAFGIDPFLFYITVKISLTGELDDIEVVLLFPGVTEP